MAFELVSGSQAAAIAVQRVGVDLVSAYPITPQTAIVETLANFDAKGELGADFVSVESEYSALACCYGAAAGGARVFTATASHGLAYMHEMIHWLGGARLPVVMVNVNRSIGAPWCLDPDQGDSLSQRDTGWMQIYCAGAQEVFDTVLQAYLLAEELLLPCMVVFDGFYISHTYEAVDLPDQEQVRSLIGPPAFKAQVVPGEPGNIHGIIPGEKQLGLVRLRHQAMLRAPELFLKINERFAGYFGRQYGILEVEIPEGAKRVIVTAGAMSETVRAVLPELSGTGLIQLRMFRPFPVEQLRKIVTEKEIEELLVIDRNCSTGMGGIFAQEVRAALYGIDREPQVHNISLAGGVDLTPAMLHKIVSQPAPDRKGEAVNAITWGDQL